MLKHCKAVAPSHEFSFKRKLYSLDATLIELCVRAFPWATYRQTKGAIKLNLLLDHDGYLPVFMDFTHGNVHEVISARHIDLPRDWDFLIEALQKLGYSVLLAENGLDAVEIYEANPSQIDLVLLDMIMPKQGGHQTFFRIRSLNPEAKILLSSGFVSEAEVHDLLTQGACGFLPKPHRLPTVARAIRDVLDNGRLVG